MGAKLGSVPFLARMGVSALDPAEGAARFVELVTSDPGVRQPIVTAGFIGLPTWPASWPDDPALRFTLGERRGVPGVEARVRVAPHPDRDVWLRDHDYRGSRLLPTVFGLEAMAQAAWLARGGGDDPVSSIHDIELPSPIVIADHGTLVELRAVVREEDPFAVDCEVRSETTGFSRAHFSATLRFAASLAEAESLALPDLPPPVPDLDPVADLYGGLLFQGPAFHRMGKIRGGNARTMRFVGEVKEPGARERLLLGDPFFRDALLQASQVLVAQDDALPVRIARLGLARGHAEPGPYEVLATIHESRGTAHVANVSVASPDGRRRQWLEGYEVRVLAHHATRPDFETVLRPGRWGEETLRARLSALLAARALPAVTLGLHDVALHGLSRDERHRRIPPLVASLDPGFENALSWEESGRPILRSGRAISIAHDAGCCLIVVGVGEEIAGAKTVTPGLGCDLEPIRGRADWNALLGPSRARLAASLRPQEDRDLAGTRVWAACEALHKAGAANETADRAPSVVSRDGEVVELALGAFRVLTFPLAFPRGSARMVAVAFGPAREQAPLEPSPAAAEQKTPALPDPDLLSVRLVEGRPSRFEARFVVAFDESGSLSGRVPATTLASWMGRLREVALAGLKRPILEALASGQHGMVTQSAWVRLTGEASALDRIEAHVFVEELRPSTCLLRFSFARVAEDGSKQPLGEASQRFGWVHVLGHGEVRGAPFPGFLAEFLADLHVEGATLEHEAPPLLLPRSREATRLRVPTSLADGNVVGNLYYANYFKWAQRALERLVFRNAKEALRARGRLGELTVTSMRLEFLREAMPFDDIDVALHLAVSETGGAQDLAFDLVYTREEADSGVTRLALARVEAVWVPGDGADTEAEEEVRVPTWLRPSPDRERRPVREPFEVATAHRELSTTASVSSPIPNVPAHQEVL